MKDTPASPNSVSGLAGPDSPVPRLLLTALLCIPVLLAGTGCATTRVTRITWRNSERLQGYRYCLPQPYLLVSEPATSVMNKTDGTLKSEKSTETEPQMEIIYLPDMREQYSIRPWAFLAKQDLGFTLENGWNLTSVNAKQDATAALEAMAGLAESMVETAPNLIKALTDEPGQEQPGQRELLRPGLYRIILDEAEVRLEFAGPFEATP